MKSSNCRFKVIDLFAGAGGFSLGFHLAGYDVVCALEQDKWAIDTLTINKHCKSVIHADIQNIKTSEQINKTYNGIPDIIIGGPPCQGFSFAGPAKKDPKDPRNTLFKDFAKWIDHFQPQFFVMENVKGILLRKNAKNERVIDIIKEAFQDLKYTLEIWVLNAAEYGVPQMRERVFIVGHRQKTVIGPPPKTHFITKQNESYVLNNNNLLPAISLGSAILDLPELDAGEGKEEQSYTNPPQNDYQKWARSKNCPLYNHVAMKHTPRIVERFKLIQQGSLLAEVPEEYKVRERNGNGKLSLTEYHSNYRHLKAEEIAYTIPASFYSSFIHPTQPRNITAREAARLQSFPDWYRFMGKRTVISSKLLKSKGRHQEEDFLSQYNQIGNAVPPLLAKAIAEHIFCFLEKESEKVDQNLEHSLAIPV